MVPGHTRHLIFIQINTTAKLNILGQQTAWGLVSERVKQDLTMLHDGCPTAKLRSNSAHLCQPFKQQSTDSSTTWCRLKQACTFCMHGKCINNLCSGYWCSIYLAHTHRKWDGYLHNRDKKLTHFLLSLNTCWLTILVSHKALNRHITSMTNGSSMLACGEQDETPYTLWEDNVPTCSLDIHYWSKTSYSLRSYIK